MISNKLFLLLMMCPILNCVEATAWDPGSAKYYNAQDGYFYSTSTIWPYSASTPNPEGYNLIAGTNSSYKVYKSHATFFDAKKTCENEGATLFYPETEIESKAVLSSLTNYFEISLPYYMHVGLQAKGFTLKTLNGTFVDTRFMRWLKWYPNNNINRKCLRMTYTHYDYGKTLLHNVQCYVTLPFICKSKYIEDKQVSSLQESYNWESTSSTVSGTWYDETTTPDSGDNESTTTSDTWDNESTTSDSRDNESTASGKILYIFHKKPMTVSDAKKACYLEGSTLFYPDNEDESNAILLFLKNNYHVSFPINLHVGLQAKGFALKTIDGSLYNNTFMLWYPKSSLSQTCLTMTYFTNSLVKLTNTPCYDIKHSFVCKTNHRNSRQYDINDLNMVTSSLEQEKETTSTTVTERWNEETTDITGTDYWSEETTTGTDEYLIETEDIRAFKKKDYFHIPRTKALYKYYPTPKTFWNAKTICEDEGASLYYPETEKESNTVLSYLRRYKDAQYTYGWYLGIVRSGNNFIPFNEPPQLRTYINWESGEPNNVQNSENCVVFVTALKAMKDISCTTHFDFICKWQPHSASSYVEPTTIPVSRDVESTTSDFSITYDEPTTDSDVTVADIPNPPDYQLIPETNSLYKFYKSPAIFLNAKKTCEHEGATLFYPETENESNAVRSLLTNNFGISLPYYLHVGLQATSFTLKTLNRTFVDTTFMRWLKWYPSSNINQKCIRMTYPPNSEIILQNVQCYYTLPFICKSKYVEDKHESTILGEEFIAVHNSESSYRDNEYTETTPTESSYRDNEYTETTPTEYSYTNIEYTETTPTDVYFEVTTRSLPQITNETDVEATTRFSDNTTTGVKSNNSLAETSTASPVEKDYNFIPGTKRFYKLHKTVSNFTAAENICKNEGSTLFYPDTEKEIQLVFEFLKNNFGIAFPYNLHVGQQSKDYVENKNAMDNVFLQENTDEYDNKCISMTFLPNATTIFNIKPCFSLRPFICKTQISGWNDVCNVTNDATASVRKYAVTNVTKQGTYSQIENFFLLEVGGKGRSYGYAEQLGKCYKFHLTPRKWTDARLKCRAENAELAVINSREEAAYLVRLTSSIPKLRIPNSFPHGVVLLGFHNIDVKDWQTVQGTSLYHSGYACWGNSQPDGGDRDRCGSMFYNGHLNDIACDQKAFFICEHNVANYEHEPPPQFVAQQSLKCYDDI